MRNAALNTLATEQIAQQVKMKLLEALLGIITASVKPFPPPSLTEPSSLFSTLCSAKSA